MPGSCRPSRSGLGMGDRVPVRCPRAVLFRPLRGKDPTEAGSSPVVLGEKARNNRPQ